MTHVSTVDYYLVQVYATKIQEGVCCKCLDISKSFESSQHRRWNETITCPCFQMHKQEEVAKTRAFALSLLHEVISGNAWIFKGIKGFCLNTAEVNGTGF